MAQEHLTESVSREPAGASPGEFVKPLFQRAENSLEFARALVRNEHWAGSCFSSCTAAGQALEAYLTYAGQERGDVESAGVMAQMCAELQPDFSRVIAKGKYLDRYYAITRYPDSLPAGAVPHLWFNRDDAEHALNYAAEIVDFTRRRLLQDIYAKRL